MDLYLSGDNQLISPNGKAGIYAPGNTSLTIKSLSGDDKRDTLVAKAGSGGAGIGGEGYVGTGANAGSITIDGGTITAMGGNLGTGIGGCDQGTAKITINGGYVTAKGGDGVPNTVAKNTKGAPTIRFEDTENVELILLKEASPYSRDWDYILDGVSTLSVTGDAKDATIFISSHQERLQSIKLNNVHSLSLSWLEAKKIEVENSEITLRSTIETKQLHVVESTITAPCFEVEGEVENKKF